MLSPNLKQTVIALSLLQAFALSAHAQTTMQEIIVSGSKWVPTDRATVGGFSDTPLMELPSSVTAIGREQLDELQVRSTTDATRFDASVSDSYNAVGYSEQFSIRGFLLENVSSYRKDNIAISADALIALENKERFEILKGAAGLQAGVTGPGGIINYVTKRPTAAPLRSVVLEARERGTVYGAIDLGGRMEDKRFGYRFNGAAEKLRSYVRGADGNRQFVSGALDWQISPDALVQLDMDYQRMEQITAPGYQLTRGTDLPRSVSPKVLLNAQPWTKPVDTTSSNIGLRFEYKLNDAWSATLAANKHTFKRDDYTAFPYGCSNEGAGFYPGYCSNGDYDVYDYQSVGERKTPFGTQALLQGKFATSGIRHDLTLGWMEQSRSDYFGEYVYDYVGSSNIYNNQIVPPVSSDRSTGPVLEQRRDQERSFVIQDILTLSPQYKLHAGLRHVQVKREVLGTENVDTGFTLPNVSLVYMPSSDWMVYGTAAHGMEHGGTADMGTENENVTLAPSRSKQLELGFKGVLNNNVTLSGALFEIKRGFEFENEADYFVRAGEQTHRGLELGAQGAATTRLKYSVSLLALHMQQQGTGQASLDGKRTTNVPAFKSTTVLDYSVPGATGLSVNGVWRYSGKKAFDPQNTVFVPDYHVFDLGASYATRLAGMRTTLRAKVANVTDKFYWNDVTPLLGGYLIAGAPRTLRVTAQFDF